MVNPLTMAERVALRYARGVMPGANQIRSIQRVLADLDRSKIYMDFDLLSDLFTELSRSPLVGGAAAEQAKGLASRLAEIHRYTTSYVLNAMNDVNNFISGGLSLPPGSAHPRGVFENPH